MPPKASTVTAAEIHTCGRRNTPSSPRRLVLAGAGVAGTSNRIPASATTPMTVIAQNVKRQPNCWPSSVPSGTPSALATVSPANISEMAPARRFCATMSAATTEPTPKNAPWHSAATTRPAISTEYPGATAEIRLPAMNNTINPSSTFLRSNRAIAAVSAMAPTATLSAYPETR